LLVKVIQAQAHIHLTGRLLEQAEVQGHPAAALLVQEEVLVVQVHILQNM
jgi:hypothetical protein